MNIYEIEKNNFSNLHSSFHKLLNNLKKNNKLSKEKEIKILEINNCIEILNSKLITFNNDTDYNLENKLKEIDNDNKVINNLIPIALMYRMMLTP